MVQTITLNTFRNAFTTMNRENNFSYEGLEALFNYLESIEEDIKIKMELDVIALCCEFTEYENLKELQEDYNDIEDMEDLENSTTVIMIDDERFIILDF